MPFYLGWGLPQYIILHVLWFVVFVIAVFALKSPEMLGIQNPRKLAIRVLLLALVILQVSAWRIGDRQEELIRHEFNTQVDPVGAKTEVKRYNTADAEKEFNKTVKENKQ